MFDGLFAKFRRGRRGRQRGNRSSGPRSRDAHSQTEMLQMPSTPPPQPQSGFGGFPPQPQSTPPLAPPPSYPPPVQPPQQQYSPPPQVRPPVQSGGMGQSMDAGGATRLINSVEAPSSVVAVLIGIGGRFEGEVFKLRDGENRMGRERSMVEVALEGRDDTISRLHAVIIHQSGKFGLKPLAPKNPTFVNGDAVESGIPVSDGDVIRMGQSSFKFRTV